MLTVPNGSKIVIDDHSLETRITIPYPSEMWRRLPGILFLSVWLCGWVGGELFAITMLLYGNETHGDGPPGLFMVCWLGGWTVAGCCAMYALYRLWQPPIPESFTLTESTLLYDSGRPAFRQTRYCRQPDDWQKLFPKRKQLEFEPEELQTLQLREFAEGNRLTIDREWERIELAQEATDLEREWLYDVLQARYL